MSRYEYTPPRWPAHTSFAVGWDPPLATFFAQVMDESISEDDDRVIVWIGGLPPYFKNIDEVMRIVNRRIRGRLPALSLTKKMRDRLTRDKEREDEKRRAPEPGRKGPLCALDLAMNTPTGRTGNALRTPPSSAQEDDARQAFHQVLDACREE